MLTSCTSSEEENTPYPRKLGHNIKNNDEGDKLAEDTANYHVCRWENIVPRFQTSHSPNCFQSSKETPL